MPAADRFHASVRIDVNLTCAHPDELIDGLSDEQRMGSAGLDGEDALLSLIRFHLSLEKVKTILFHKSEGLSQDSANIRRWR